MSAATHEAMERACRELGVIQRDVPADGEFHPADLADDPKGKGDGRIKRFADGEGGIVRNWKTDAQRVFWGDDGRTYTPAERRAQDAKRQATLADNEAKDRQRRAEAAKKSAELFAAASPAQPDHPYLQRKKVEPTTTLRELPADEVAQELGYRPQSGGVPLQGRVLIAAVVNIDGHQTSAELIDEAGRKSAVKDGAKAGNFWAAGELPEGDGAGLTLLIGEGVATVLSASAATGCFAVAALSCGNLKPVAVKLGKVYPLAKLAVLADLGNGQAKAEEAAQAAGAALALPVFDADAPEGSTDFNDMACLSGADAVARVIAEAVGGHGGAGETATGAWPAPLPLTAKIEPEDYPLDALPPLIHAAVAEVQGYVQAPDALVASSALGAVSLACQGLIDVQRGEHLSGPSSLYLLTIAESGERKSTVDGFFMAAVRKFDAERAKDAIPLMADYRAMHAAWGAKRSGLQEKIRELAKKDAAAAAQEANLRELEREEPQRPRYPQMLLASGDTTPEAVAYDLAHAWPSAGCFASEAGLVFGAQAMKSESVMKNLSQLNLFWDGAPVEVRRRGEGGTFAARGVRLTTSLMVQEQTLNEFLEKNGALARGSGFLARFLVAWPRSTQGSRFYREPPDAAGRGVAAFADRVVELLRVPLTLDGGELRPTMLSLDRDTKQAWVRFHDAIEAELAPGGELTAVRDVASKSADNAARLAALFQQFEHGGGAVNLDCFERASRIVAWHLHEARRFFGELALPRELADAARLDGWLVNRVKETQEDAVNKNHVRQYGPLRDGGRLDAALRELVALDRVRLEASGKSTLICVNPALARPPCR